MINTLEAVWSFFGRKRKLNGEISILEEGAKEEKSAWRRRR